VVVTGDVGLGSGSTLLAGFAKNDVTGSGTSGLTVDGSVAVGQNSTLLLGCYATSFPCLDDPNQKSPSLNSPQTVRGNVNASAPLGVVVHDTTVGGSIIETGGGGGVNCTPTGPFASFKSPVYSDYEDSTVGGNLWVTGLRTCWIGFIRDHIGGSVVYSNNIFADPDSSEVLTYTIGGNLICEANQPAVQYGDSGGHSDVVGGYAAGQCAFSVRVPSFVAPGSPTGPPAPIAVPSPKPSGYWLAGADGGVFSFGVPFYGSFVGRLPSAQSVVGFASLPGGLGYGVITAAGVVDGTSRFQCFSPGQVGEPIVAGMVAPGGLGCYAVTAGGEVLSAGLGASTYGSAAGVHLNKPVVGMAIAPLSNGYYLVASDGGVFTFGPGSAFRGSMGGSHLNKPVVGMAVDPETGGYWLVASDGGVFSFSAPFYGSMGAEHLNSPIVGIAAAPDGQGYYLVAADGGVFTFGPGAHFIGSMGAAHLNEPVVGIALG
jgi:hypothetical protein